MMILTTGKYSPFWRKILEQSWTYKDTFCLFFLLKKCKDNFWQIEYLCLMWTTYILNIIQRLFSSSLRITLEVLAYCYNNDQMAVVLHCHCHQSLTNHIYCFYSNNWPITDQLQNRRLLIEGKTIYLSYTDK